MKKKKTLNGFILIIFRLSLMLIYCNVYSQSYHYNMIDIYMFTNTGYTYTDIRYCETNLYYKKSEKKVIYKSNNDIHTLKVKKVKKTDYGSILVHCELGYIFSIFPTALSVFQPAST